MTDKRPRGRPPGRNLTHEARVLMRPEVWHELQNMAAKEGTSAAQIIRDRVEMYMKRHRYPMEHSVSSVELADKLVPIIEGLKVEGRKHAATMSVQTVARYARQLEILLDDWEG